VDKNDEEEGGNGINDFRFEKMYLTAAAHASFSVVERTLHGSKVFFVNILFGYTEVLECILIHSKLCNETNY
jgi:hypothetical protein